MNHIKELFTLIGGFRREEVLNFLVTLPIVTSRAFSLMVLNLYINRSPFSSSFFLPGGDSKIKVTKIKHKVIKKPSLRRIIPWLQLKQTITTKNNETTS